LLGNRGITATLGSIRIRNAITANRDRSNTAIAEIHNGAEERMDAGP
jgi:hypothetical protein